MSKPPAPPPVVADPAEAKVVRPYSKRAKRAGELVELRVATANWVAVTKPTSRRGKNYKAHVLAVKEQFQQLGVPQTSANYRRMGISRVAKLKKVLAELREEESAVVKVE
jgi:hypothetical protein